MATPGTFRWTPRRTSRVDVAPEVDVVPFGDGYEQRLTPQIHSTPEVWSFEFVEVAAEAVALHRYLKIRKGSVAFMVEHPDTGEPLRVVCPSWSRAPENRSNHRQRVRARFREVIE